MADKSFRLSPSPDSRHFQRVLLYGLALLLIILTAVLAGWMLGINNSNSSKASEAADLQQNMPDGTLVNACKVNGKGNLDEILRIYTVKKGDSILSISKNELGDPSRYQELAVMNGDRYPVLFSSPGVVAKNPFLEQGWKLLLPPVWIESSSGQLDIINGLIFANENDGLKITTSSDESDWIATLKIDKNSIVPQGKELKVGDCINAVRDVRLNRVIKISLQ